ncbi:MAG: hypothetical protein JST04_02410 [Bdellovibrionales bacterium]|nr:hypothetical protein [Bdellovibrionales bacterium]
MGRPGFLRILGLTLGVLTATSAFAAGGGRGTPWWQSTWLKEIERKVCPSFLSNILQMKATLPERLRSLIETSRVQHAIVDRDASWAKYHAALDRAFNNAGTALKPGEFVTARIDDLSVAVRFHRNVLGKLELEMKDLKIKGIAAGESDPSGIAFLDFVASNMSWIAKARAEDVMSDTLRVIADHVDSKTVREMLESMGFEAGGPTKFCYLAAVVGTVAGAGLGRGFFTLQQRGLDAENPERVHDGEEEKSRMEREIAWGAGAGFLGGVGVMCFRKNGRDYSMTLDTDAMDRAIEKPKSTPATGRK